MHELSLAMEVIELVQLEAEKTGVTRILEINIEVGDLSGVEAETFQSALSLIVKDSILNDALIKVFRTPGKGKCNSCNAEFDMTYRLETCPQCQCFPSEISGGQEFRVVSIII